MTEVAQPLFGGRVIITDTIGKRVMAKALMLPRYKGPALAATMRKGETYVWLVGLGEVVGHSLNAEAAYTMAVGNVKQLIEKGIIDMNGSLR